MKDLIAEVLSLNPQCLSIGEGKMRQMIALAKLEQKIEDNGFAILFDATGYRVYTRPSATWMQASNNVWATRGEAISEAASFIPAE